ncbi:MAG TPA: phosphate starvation-inducible protein PhoH [Cyanobacteria bacterium UBA11149]|nr:phosphate starvation-inducible protein PhoH [Cyanobacteria bacterium UBA11367]HBE58060.1 phosphate starvation-inducible protein PhoH [Cyanobacteria bacterium UBA11366]HBR74955.1 phosphate starvation-inducible protein PhoH [Cyanobacteria bacterium UBA11159]HBS71509.1 phosphate starvation-inducible protein PhoH [Cyanobacteria bacterium UBA11153]HBW88193.1 phosphate starvation-inducible protein PhoH [Cyanobacteria bacterium UBA11149]HCA94826.1 phosphate starvation-inducible protein PhoH [Cyano
MKKTFVLDTNVLLHDPSAMLRFQDNDVILPITVIEELDRFKKQPEMTGRNARQVSRTLDNLRERSHLIDGITINGGGCLRVALCDRETLRELPPELEGDKGDNAILAVALELKQRCDCPVVVVSKDTNLRIKADALGLAAEDYETDKVDVEELYTGTTEVWVDNETIEHFFKDGSISLDKPIFPNQAVTLIDSTNPSHTALAIAFGRGETATDNPHTQLIPAIKVPHGGISHIQPRNREQKFALDLLLRDSIQLVTLVGKAGTGKTLLAIAAGLHQVANERIYNRLLISRPVIPMGKDIGYLPGDVSEKLTPWMQPLYDNFDLIFGTQEPQGKPAHWRRGHEELIERGLLQIEPLTYIRGRTIPKQFMIVDEAQNLTPHEVKTILTRAGEGTKIVLTGDLDQIDNPYVDAASNGLTYVVERFKEEPLAGHITLSKGERSHLAERATILL